MNKKQEAGHIRGVCVICGKNKQKRTGSKNKDGLPTYKAFCSPCDKRRFATEESKKKRVANIAKMVTKCAPYRLRKKSTCEECGFIPVHSCQLEVDHIDGNHQNNDPSNLQTLCANCHRLKTYKQLYSKAS